MWAEQVQARCCPGSPGPASWASASSRSDPEPALSTDLLRQRLAGTNVDVIRGDGADTGLPSDQLTTATAFSVLHHVPSAEHQDRILAEIFRLLAPGGTFVGIDARDLDMIRQGDEADTFVPIRPETFKERATQVGFVDTSIDETGDHFRFITRKPVSGGLRAR